MSDANEWNKKVIAEFRANGGKVGGRFENMQLLLLHTTGAKSGLPRINPVAQIADGDRYVVIASKGGAPSHPDWYYNLAANSDVTIEVGTEKFAAHAQVAEEPERSALFDKMAQKYPVFAQYRQNTERTIPVVILSRKL